MAKQFLVSVDLTKNELLNARLQNLPTAPASPVAGQVWFNSTTGRLEFRGVTGAGTGATPAAGGAAATIDPTSRAHHYGKQLAETIDDFAAAARSAVGGADLVMGGNKITGLPSATTNDEPATYGQLLSVQNGTDWKQSVRVASTANIATLSGLLTIDGVTLQVGDRVLVKNQSSAAANGIYLAASGAWTRAADAVQGQLTSGAAVMVTEGTLNGDSQWRLTTDDPISVGSTALLWAQIGAGTSYVQGTGINISGNSIAVDTAVVVRKYATAVGGSTSVAVTHNLGTRDVTVAVYDAATYEEVECDVVRTTVNQVTLGFNTAPVAASLRCVVHA